MPAVHAWTAGLTVITVAVLGAVLAWSPELAARIVREDDVVEWAEVALFAGAVGFAAAAARRPPRVLNVLMALMFTALIEGELDLDRRILGVPVIDARFLMNPAVWLGHRLLVGLVLAGAGVAVLTYAWRRRDPLWRETRAMAREPWGHVFLAGVLLFALIQPFEKRLNALLPLPRAFLEESLEMLAALFCFVALAARALTVRRAPSDRPPGDGDETAARVPGKIDR